jgi:protoporphyrinogen/coproporphyrinogen III oxidase
MALGIESKQVAIIGGGISGLAAAFRLCELNPGLDVALYEAGPRLGGILRSEDEAGYLIEHGPDMFSTAEPWAVDLCRRLGFAEEDLLNTDARFRRAFVVRKGKLLPVPEGLMLLQPRKVWPVLMSRLLSWRGRLRMLAEPFIAPRRASADESLADFAVRRFGREAFERLIQPLVGGIYTADPERLSMAATMGRFAAMERQYGSLMRAAFLQRGAESQQNSSGARYGMFVAPRHGMQQFVEQLEKRLPPNTVFLNQAVRAVQRLDDGRWQLEIAEPASPVTRRVEAQALIVAAPAPVAGTLLAGVDSQLGHEISAIPYAGAALAVLGYARKHVAHRLDAFGFVVPMCEQRRILAASFASLKFAGRAPREHVLFRVYIGGACQPELLEKDDTALLTLAQQELRELLGTSGAPHLSRLIRWPAAMPQYHVGHLERIARIEQLCARYANLALAGNAYRGVGIPFCIRSGELAAERVAAAAVAQQDHAKNKDG